MMKKYYHLIKLKIKYLIMWFWSKFHPCRIGWKKYEHELTYIDDTYGADDVINGTCVCGHWECERCGYAPKKQDGLPCSYDEYH